MKSLELPPEGSVRWRSDGRWEVRLTVGHELDSGKPLVRSRYATTEEDAVRKLWELYREREGEGLVPQELSVLKLFELYLDSKENVKKSTLYKLQKEAAPLLTAFGRLKAQRLKRGRVQGALDQLRAAGRSNDSRRRALRTLRATLQFGVDAGYLSRNVAASLKVPATNRGITAEVWNEEQVALFLRVSSGELQVPYKYKLTAPPRKTVPPNEFLEVDPRHAEPHQMHELFYVLLATGVRLGEALGLRWKNVNLKDGRIHIREALTSSDGKGAYKLSTPKTPHSIRTFRIGKDVIDAFKSEHERQKRLRAVMKQDWPDTGFVFTTNLGTPYNGRNVLRAFKAVIRPLEIPQIRLHDLRHTHASLALRSGEPIESVSKRLGHANISITLNTYRHLYTDELATASLTAIVKKPPGR